MLNVRGWVLSARHQELLRSRAVMGAVLREGDCDQGSGRDAEGGLESLLSSAAASPNDAR